MKFLLLALLSTLLVSSFATSFLDNDEGLCVNVPSTCPTSTQRYGVCCSRTGTGRGTLYNNWCLACKTGCMSFTYADSNGRCS